MVQVALFACLAAAEVLRAAGASEDEHFTPDGDRGVASALLARLARGPALLVAPRAGRGGARGRPYSAFKCLQNVPRVVI